MAESVQRPYTVSKLTREIKLMLEGSYPGLLLEGEVSNFKPASSGHWYFTLRDEQSMIQAVMFRGSQTGTMPTNGQMLRVRASLSVYAKRGNYQLICSSIENAGDGHILQMLEERKRRLASEGLFDAEHKKPLPFFPKRVVILSSETGAAVRDIIQVIRRRAPWLNLCIANIPVQGEGAGTQIARRLAAVETVGDVIILSRGGGSLEDLLPFSDEKLIRAIHRCETPVISAVGHEIDWALSDFVADLRAPTPSAAAELLCSDVEDIRIRILTAGRIIIQAFSAQRQRLALALRPFRKELLEQSFRGTLRPHQLALDDAREFLIESMLSFMKELKQRFHLALRALTACDPYTVLRRGYAIVRNVQEEIVGTARNLDEKSDISIQFHDGTLSAQVQGGLKTDRYNEGERE